MDNPFIYNALTVLDYLNQYFDYENPVYGKTWIDPEIYKAFEKLRNSIIDQKYTG